MARPRLSVIDNRDDAREIFRALHSLPPLARVCAAAAIVRTAAGFGGVGNARVRAETFRKALWADRVFGASGRLTDELVRDLCLVVSNYGLDPLVMANAVVGYARRPRTVPHWSQFISREALFAPDRPSGVVTDA